jgi:hypothetical protein
LPWHDNALILLSPSCIVQAIKALYYADKQLKYWLLKDGAMRSQLIFVVAATLALTACGDDLSNKGTVYPTGSQVKRTGSGYKTDKDQDLFNGEGFNLFGGNKNQEQGSGGGSGIGVNSFLWRAALDTVSFMPLASADPFGGVILTDWYSPPETPNERFKLNIFILDRQLRVDGLRVAVFKEVEKENLWRASAVEKKAAINIENRILERARELKIASAKIN